jgi:hypothetical protein
VEAAQVLRRLENPVEVERFLKRLTIETGFSEAVLLEQVGRRRAAKAPETPVHTPAYAGKNREDDGYIRAEKDLIAMLAIGEKAPRALLKLSDFTDPACAFMAKILLEENGDIRAVQSAMEQMEDEGLRGDISRILLLGEQCEPDRKARLIANCVDRLLQRRVEREIAQLEERSAQPGLTAQEQLEIASMLSPLYGRLERLKQGGGE